MSPWQVSGLRSHVRAPFTGAAKMAAPHTAATSAAAPAAYGAVAPALVTGNIDNWQHFHIGNIPHSTRAAETVENPAGKCYTNAILKR